MELTVTNIILIVITSALGYFGSYLYLSKVTKNLRNTLYESSRKYLGIGFLVLSLSAASQFALEMFIAPEYYIAALNMTFLYIASKFIALTFFTIIGRKAEFFTLRHNSKLYLMVLFPVIILSTLFIPDPTIRLIVQAVCAIKLSLNIIKDCIYFIKNHKSALEQGDFYKINDIIINTDWIDRSATITIAASIITVTYSLTYPYLPSWADICYLIMLFGACVYTFNKFVNITVIFGESTEKALLELLLLKSDDIKPNLSPENYQLIQQQVLKWIQSKEYTKPGITLQSAAVEMSTNRLYLSNYINATYKCSFRVWVSQLRVNESKKILLDSPCKKITIIAEEVGFQSLTSFTHVFTKLEGLSPKQWIAQNIK